VATGHILSFWLLSVGSSQNGWSAPTSRESHHVGTRSQRRTGSQVGSPGEEYHEEEAPKKSRKTYLGTKRPSVGLLCIKLYK